MKKFSRTIGILLTLAVTASAVFTGCGDNNSATGSSTASADSSAVASASEAFKPDISKEVKLIYYHIGQKAPQEEQVLANLNTKLKAKINATLDVKYLSWGDAWTQGPLLFASGQDFDLIFCAPWFLFGDQGQKGAFKELDDLLPKYAPDIWKEAPAEVWKQASINGNIYAIPQYAANNAGFDGLVYREDLRKKYNVPEIKKMVDLEPYFAAIKANEPKLTPFGAYDASGSLLPKLYVRENSNYVYSGTEDLGFVYDVNDPTAKVVYMPLTSQYEEWTLLAKKWADAGYWSKNALSNKTSDRDQYKAGTAAVSGQNSYWFNELYKSLKQTQPTAETGFYMTLSQDGKTDRKPYFQNGVSVNANSKNPERTVMLVNALMYDPEIYEAGIFGIEGETFTKDSNGNYGPVPGANPEKSWGFGNMYGMGISNYKMEPKDTSLDHPDYTNKYWNEEFFNQYAVDCALTGFTFDPTPVSAEIAAINDLAQIYEPVLGLGFTKDAAATLKEYRDKLQPAGIEKITAELQKQIDAFLASKK